MKPALLILGSHEESRAFDAPARARDLLPLHAGLDPDADWQVDIYALRPTDRVPYLGNVVAVVPGCTDTAYQAGFLSESLLHHRVVFDWADKACLAVQQAPFSPPTHPGHPSPDLPMVVRPHRGRGGRGVTVIDRQDDDLSGAVELAGSNPVLTAYVPGPQVSVEAVILDGHTHVVALGDRHYHYPPPFPWTPVELGGNTPSALPAEIQADIRAVTRAFGLYVHEVTGISSTPLKLDIVVGPDGPRVIESHLRLGGGWFATRQIREIHNVNLVEVAVDIALGLYVDPARVRPHRPDGAIAWRLRPDGSRSWGRADTIHEAIRLAEEAP
jgi:hypothetical protein